MLSRQNAQVLGILTAVAAVLPYLALPAMFFVDILAIPLIALAWLLGIAVFVAYIVVVLKMPQEQLLGGELWPWLLVLIVGGAAGQIVFWYLNLWKPLLSAPLEPPSQSAPQADAAVAPGVEVRGPLSMSEIAARARLAQYGKLTDRAEALRASDDLETLMSSGGADLEAYAEYRAIFDAYLA